MITGSHNPPAYNGLKIMLGGETLSGEDIQAIYNRIKTNNFNTGEGDLQIADISADYLRRVSEDIPVALGKSFKIVIDCGNGVAGSLAPQLFRALGHDVEELYCEVDGNFPNHHPDPSQPENLEELIAKVKEGQADIGFAFDGDGDRLGVIDGEGNIIWPDRQLMLMARDVLSRNQGAKIIFDVKCSRHLKTIIEASGGEPLMWKTGHSLIKSKMKEVDAPLAGEMSGHIFFKERWYGFDDAMYAAARLVEILTNYDGKPVDAFAELPGGIATPELRLDMVETEHAGFMQALQDKMPFEGAEVVDIDGLRIEYADGWGLIRPSNTSPCLVMRFEADNQTAMERIQSEFRGAISQINPELQIPF
jgi:phosphomannomutase/phosphoglucomutase